VISSPSFRRLTWYTLLLFVVLGSLRLALAEDVGEIVSALGTVEVLRQGRWQPVATGEKVAAGEAIKTGEGSRIALQLVNGAQLKINANSQLELKHIVSQEGLAPTANAPTLNILRVPQGEIWVRSNGIPLELQTISVVATIRGTEFNLAVKPDHSARLAVFDGLIDFHNAQGSVLVEANEQATVRLGEAPRKTVLLNPIDAAQWSLYYPGTVSYRDYLLAGQALPHPNGRSQKRPIAASQATVEQLISQAETRFNSGNRQEARQLFAQALQHDPDHPHARTGLGWTLLEAGAVDAALAAFQQVRPPTLMSAVGTANSLYQLNRFTQADQVIAETQRQFPQASLPWVQAALNALIRGRVDEAHRALDQALTRDPRSALAHSLRSNIYLVQNQKERALEAAERAVAVNPSSPTAYLNLSLVKQAEFNLNAALAAAQKAVALDPENPQALIQESRLLFGMGDIRQATQLAQQAYHFRPGDPIVHSTWGFLQLAQGRIQEAIQSFQEAIAQDSTLGEPHLGLGIALFRQNQTEAATQEILKATLLEPKVSLYSSYLGKAFYELKDDHATQKHLAKAKQLDPHDPTPYYYDAIRLQSVNRPIEALQSLQTSIDLNDNRAVYRSRLLLDEDLATRATTLGRSYNELGFGQLGLSEGTKSVTLDPANHSAHRLLADSYAAMSGVEAARTSELLQAQLLQPINITPVSPQMAETKLLMPEAGPITPSLYEFSPLFVRNRPTLFFMGLGGNQAAWSNEFIAAGLTDRVSYSLGQFHYQSDGYRPNNDLENNIYSLFAQTAVTPNFNLQGEYRYRQTISGDLRSNFDGSFSLGRRRDIEQDTARIGMNYSLSPGTNLLASVVYVDRESEISSKLINFRSYAVAGNMYSG
jgi:tetratricopeptide (TPR) repeat protein